MANRVLNRLVNGVVNGRVIEQYPAESLGQHGNGMDYNGGHELNVPTASSGSILLSAPTGQPVAGDYEAINTRQGSEYSRIMPGGGALYTGTLSKLLKT